METHHFIINKTSFDMFDVFRAYGLAYLISGFEKNVETNIFYYNYAFIIEARGKLPTKPDPKLFEETDSAWSIIFRTFKERKDLKALHPRKDAENIVTQEFNHLLDLHKKFAFIPQMGKQVKDGRTLYQTLDVSAAKGYREEKRDVYHDGSQIEVDKYSWATAVIGAAWSSVWPLNLMRRDVAFLICMVPNPKKVLLISHHDVQNRLDRRLCGISANTALIHYALKLVQLVREKSDEVEYDSVIFNVMQKTGQQPKPGGGGKYNLDFLEKLAKTNAGFYASENIDKHLLPTNPRVKGIQQDVALALTDFLLRPSLENLRIFESLYVRGQINHKFPQWDKQQLEEILKNVEAK